MPIQTIKTPLSNDLLFFIACCQTEVSKEDIHLIQKYLNTPNIDIPRLIALAIGHGILPLVYKTIKTIQSDSTLVNTEILLAFKTHYMRISQRNMLMSAELIRIIKLLKDHGIEALAFKGPTLSQMAYGDITLRQYGDLDVLIRKKDRSKMMSLLIGEHYIPEINLQKKTEKTFFDCVNVIGLYKSSSSILIEVHWELLSKNYAIDWEEERLWSKKESVTINNIAIPVLSPEQLLLYLCTHGAKHLFERLEWVCDIDRSLRSNPNFDWHYLLNEAQKLGIKRMLYLGLALCEQFFNLELPETIQKEIVQDQKIPKLISQVILINFSETSQKGKNYSSFGVLWSMRENFSDQLRFAWRGLFAPKFDDFVFIQLPKHLAFLYPIIRPYRLLTKYSKH
ncbi:MAG: nucleotidyltransferase family protein [Sulfurovum sp.]|nr:nucleotidyltransferase family protein [Sulfurovum sp.]